MTAITQEMEDFLASCDLTIPFILIDEDAGLEDSIVASQPQQRRRKKQTDVDKLEMIRVEERKRCSNYRQRQRDERERLQKEEKLLMAKLSALQKEKKDSAMSSTSVWKLFARRQLEARINAETQQRRLCQAIETRAAYIREFQELSQRRIEDVGLTLDDLQTNSETASTIPFCKLFVQDLDGLHAQTDDCLNAFGEFSPFKVWEEKDSGCFQFIDRHELLCGFEQACQMLWDAVQLRHRQECRRDFHHVPDPATASAFNFRVSTCLSSGQVVSALQRVVTCRYRTRDRQVFVWQAYMDGEGMFTGLRAGETGWDILTRSVDASGQEKVTRTSIIWHTSMHFANTAIPEAVAKQFTLMTTGSVAEDGDEIAKRFQEINIAV